MVWASVRLFLTPARETALAPAIGGRHIPEPMAGSPLKRQRKLGVRNEDGSVIPFSYMPRVAELPPDWRLWSPAEKIEHLLGMSLDRAYQILSWPRGELDPLRRSMQMQVIRVVLRLGIKAALDGSLDREVARKRDRERAFAGMSGEFAAMKAAAADG